jgi:ubiquinone/menaquinone biosynthesis C-methylase UbiE
VRARSCAEAGDLQGRGELAVKEFTTGTDAYARHVGRYSDALARAMVARVGVEDGDRALDVGCGPGPLLLALAERVGTDHVAGVEPSPPFAEMARRPSRSTTGRSRWSCPSWWSTS